MIKTTRWSPDTCECVIEYDWDDAIGEDQRTHTVTRIVKACPAHDEATSEKLKRGRVYQKVINENRGKNLIINEILESNDQNVEEVDDGNGGKFKRFKKGFEPIISFDASRKLHVEFPQGKKINAQKATAINNKIQQKKQSGEIGIEVVIE